MVGIDKMLECHSYYQQDALKKRLAPYGAGEELFRMEPRRLGTGRKSIMRTRKLRDLTVSEVGMGCTFLTRRKFTARTLRG